MLLLGSDMVSQQLGLLLHTIDSITTHVSCPCKTKFNLSKLSFETVTSKLFVYFDLVL